MTDIPGKNVPPIQKPEMEGLPHKRRDETDADKGAAPVDPVTSGEAEPAPPPLPDPFAERRSDARDKATSTPRPTDKPLD